MNIGPRALKQKIEKALTRNKSILLLGPRQVGKTTLVESFESELSLSFLLHEHRQRYEQNPDLLIQEVSELKSNSKKELPLVILDEIQKVQALMDTVQYLIDRKKAKFILTGSSARKLRRSSNLNLLPGRVLNYKMDPLSLAEIPHPNIETLLMYGSLPNIYLNGSAADKQAELDAYVSAYLEEEVRAEALVRQLKTFSRFLELAALESGNPVNFTKISQDVGVAHTTIASYFEVLQDCMIVEQIPAFTQTKSRRRLAQAPKYLFFDLGVQRVVSKAGPSHDQNTLGKLFENFVGLELVRYAHLSDTPVRVFYWRDHNGPKIDWLVEHNRDYIPIEVKWSSTPKEKDIRHLKMFMDEHKSKQGFVICQTPRPYKLSSSITAIPWQGLYSMLDRVL